MLENQPKSWTDSKNHDPHPHLFLLKTVARINSNLKTASIAFSKIVLIASAFFLLSEANSQSSAPRMESDSRPSLPTTPRPSATPMATDRSSGRAAPPTASAVRGTPTPAPKPAVPNEGDARPVTPPTPPPTPKATPPIAISPTMLRTKPSPTPNKPAVVKPSPTATPLTLEPSRKFPKIVTKLMVDDLQNGRGRQAKPGAKLVVHFTSWLYDPTQPLGRGPQFETTQGKTPYKFTLQNPDTLHIKGWEDGIVDMKTGGRRRLIIPPELGYGANGAGQVVPPGATLLYEIELIDVE